MVFHTCPICGQGHDVRESRAQMAYGRQLTCSPDCESERRKRMRYHPFRPLAAAQSEPSASETQTPAARPATLPWLTIPVAAWW